MSIITFSCKTLSGALNPATGAVEEMRVGRNETSKVVFVGFIGAGRIKNGDKYEAEAFGRLPVRAAIAGSGDKQRYVLDIAGGLRGVLFKNNKKEGERDPDYIGNIEVGDKVYPLFGRRQRSDAGEFVGLSSGEAEARRERTQSGGQQSHSQPEDQWPADQEIPF